MSLPGRAAFQEKKTSGRVGGVTPIIESSLGGAAGRSNPPATIGSAGRGAKSGTGGSVAVMRALPGAPRSPAAGVHKTSRGSGGSIVTTATGSPKIKADGKGGAGRGPIGSSALERLQAQAEAKAAAMPAKKKVLSPRSKRRLEEERSLQKEREEADRLLEQKRQQEEAEIRAHEEKRLQFRQALADAAAAKRRAEEEMRIERNYLRGKENEKKRVKQNDREMESSWNFKMRLHYAALKGDETLADMLLEQVRYCLAAAEAIADQAGGDCCSKLTYVPGFGSFSRFMPQQKDHKFF